MAQNSENATNQGDFQLTSGGDSSLDMPRLKGTIGPDVVDIRRLYSELGCFTYDPGFVATASCSSELTYIDGEQGILLHRGYPIQQLVAMASSIISRS